MESNYEFAAIPESKQPCEEWLVADLQISHGFMHAGYPLVAQMKTIGYNSSVSLIFQKYSQFVDCHDIHFIEAHVIRHSTSILIP